MFDHVIQWKIRLWSYSFFHIDDVFKNNGLNFQWLSPLHGVNYDDYIIFISSDKFGEKISLFPSSSPQMIIGSFMW